MTNTAYNKSHKIMIFKNILKIKTKYNHMWGACVHCAVKNTEIVPRFVGQNKTI